MSQLGVGQLIQQGLSRGHEDALNAARFAQQVQQQQQEQARQDAELRIRQQQAAQQQDQFANQQASQLAAQQFLAGQYADVNPETPPTGTEADFFAPSHQQYVQNQSNYAAMQPQLQIAELERQRQKQQDDQTFTWARNAGLKASNFTGPTQMKYMQWMAERGYDPKTGEFNGTTNPTDYANSLAQYTQQPQRQAQDMGPQMYGPPLPGGAPSGAPTYGPPMPGSPQAQAPNVNGFITPSIMAKAQQYVALTRNEPPPQLVAQWMSEDSRAQLAQQESQQKNETWYQHQDYANAQRKMGSRVPFSGIDEFSNAFPNLAKDPQRAQFWMDRYNNRDASINDLQQEEGRLAPRKSRAWSASGDAENYRLETEVRYAQQRVKEAADAVKVSAVGSPEEQAANQELQDATAKLQQAQNAHASYLRSKANGESRQNRPDMPTTPPPQIYMIPQGRSTAISPEDAIRQAAQQLHNEGKSTDRESVKERAKQIILQSGGDQ